MATPTATTSTGPEVQQAQSVDSKAHNVTYTNSESHPKKTATATTVKPVPASPVSTTPPATKTTATTTPLSPPRMGGATPLDYATCTLLQLQRALGRTQHQHTDALEQLHFWEMDLRKHKLKVTKAAIENEATIRHIQHQIHKVQGEMQQLRREMQHIQAELDQRQGKNQPKKATTAVKSPPAQQVMRVAPMSPPSSPERPTPPASPQSSPTVTTTKDNKSKTIPADPPRVVPKPPILDLTNQTTLQLQRKLGQTQHKIQDLQAKMQFLQVEERKTALKLENQQQRKAAPSPIQESHDALQQIRQQQQQTQQSITQQQHDLQRLQTELAQRAQQAPTPAPVVPPPKRHTSLTSVGTEAQQALDQQKRAAAAARRQALAEERRRVWQEEQRRQQAQQDAFFQREQRKRDLSQKVQAQAAQVQQENAVRSSSSTWTSSVLKETVASFARETTPPTTEPPPTAPPPDAPAPTVPEVNETSTTTPATPPSSPPRHTEKSPRRDSAASGTPFENTAVVVEEEDDDEEFMARKAELRQAILLEWALQPPQMQSLKPVDELLRTIPMVFPPAHQLGHHDYFTKWKPLDLAVSPPLSTVDEVYDKQLAKAVRKLRFFLHPDRLPRDLTREQTFTVRLLWDITSDAWADYQKAQEELDWLS